MSTASAEDLARVVAFRNRLVAFINFVHDNVERYSPVSASAQSHIGQEQTILSRDYGRISRILAPYGTAGMRQYGMIVSQDVIRDAIQRPDHPGYSDVAKMAVGHLDVIIGYLQADVEDRRPARLGAPSESLYRLTSPLYWLSQGVLAVRWLLGTTRGRVTAIVGAIALTIIGGVASGAAQAWFERLFAGL